LLYQNDHLPLLPSFPTRRSSDLARQDTGRSPDIESAEISNRWSGDESARDGESGQERIAGRVEPLDVRLAAEPRPLASGELDVATSVLGDRLVDGQRAVEDSPGLGVANRAERPA